MEHYSQTSLTNMELLPGKATRRAEFFQKLDRLVPWGRWVSIVEPHRTYPQGAGEMPVPTETLLRMLVIQRVLNLSDEECEDECTDSRALSVFLGATRVPDKTTLREFRQMMVAEDLDRKLFEDLSRQLRAEGLMVREGRIVDATLVESSLSTKNGGHRKDQRAHQSKKGNN